MKDSFIDVSLEEKEFVEALAIAERQHKAITPKFLKSTQRRNLKPMEAAMKSNSKSTRIADMIGITTAKKRAGDLGAKIGVVKNDSERFPDITAQALGALLEYGSEGERFRKLKSGVVVTGRQSTGTMPATPYLRPAWDAHVNKFMDDTVEAIDNKIMKEA